MTDVLKDIIAGWAEVVEEDPSTTYVWGEHKTEFSDDYLQKERALTGSEWVEACLAREMDYARSDLGAFEFVSSTAYPPLERSAKENWVDKAGGLPDYIERIAKHVHYESGRPISMAIAIAVSTVKKWCAGGEVHQFPGVQNLSAAARAKACGAVKEWEAKKAKSKG